VILGLLSGPDARPEEGGPISDILLTGVAAATFAAIGALVVARRARNPVGWISCVVPLGMALAVFSDEYAVYAVLAQPGALPGGLVMVWLGEWIWVPTMLFGTFLLLLFPDGRLPSRRWRPVAWLAGTGMIGVAVHLAFSPGRLDQFPRTNPLGLGGAGGELAEALAFSYAVVMIAVIASVVSLVVRLRRAEGDERQQLKWLASGGAVLLLGVLLPVDSLLPALIGQVAVAGAVGIGILKYRLYDIDVVIKRTLVYGALTATLVGAYLGSVLLLQLVLSPDSDVAIAASTLAVAAVVRPARARIQELVNRRFYRQKYDAQQTLEGFGGRLRDEVDLDVLAGELRGVVTQTIQPTHVSLWIRTP